jgi:hypothetical protein
MRHFEGVNKEGHLGEGIRNGSPNFRKTKRFIPQEREENSTT